MRAKSTSILKRVLWQGFICMTLLSAVAPACDPDEYKMKGRSFVVFESFEAWNTDSECRLSGRAGYCDVWDNIPAGQKLTIIRKINLNPDYLLTTTLGMSVDVYEVKNKKRKGSYYIPVDYVEKQLRLGR